MESLNSTKTDFNSVMLFSNYCLFFKNSLEIMFYVVKMLLIFVPLLSFGAFVMYQRIVLEKILTVIDI